MAVNHLYHPWRAILSMINQCLTSKTYEHDRPRYPVLHMLWGIIRNINFTMGELMWEEFDATYADLFLTDNANLGIHKKGRKDKPHRYSLCVIYPRCLYLSLGSNSQYSSPKNQIAFHLAEEDLKLGNLKFVSKCEIDEVFGMLIPNELISNNIRNASYYNAYLEMVVKHDQKVTAQKEEKKKPASTKQSKPKPASKKSSKPAPAPKQKVTKEKSSKASTAKPPKPKPAKEKSTKATLLQKAGKGKVAKVHNVKSTFQLVNEPDKEPAHSKPEPEPEQEGASEEYDMERAIQMSLELFQITEELGGMWKRPLNLIKARLDQTLVKLMSLDLNQSSLKFLADEHIILEDPLSSTETLSSMKNLEDHHGSSHVTVLIYQASSSAPPLSTLVINLSPKNASSTTQTPVFTATTTTIKTPLPPPPQQQSTTESELAEHVATLEKKLSDLEQTNKNLDNTTQNLRSRVYTLELKDLPHKIIEAICKNVKDVV
ncbi:hypothetical protein Tco_0583733 [Tanacetum coccineum]